MITRSRLALLLAGSAIFSVSLWLLPARQAQAQYAQALWRAGDPEMAVESARRAIELDPQQTSAYSLLGDIYRALGELEQAAELYRQVISMDPLHPAANQALDEIEEQPTP